MGLAVDAGSKRAGGREAGDPCATGEAGHWVGSRTVASRVVDAEILAGNATTAGWSGAACLVARRCRRIAATANATSSKPPQARR
jgi:hypothetical protein